MAGHTLYSRAKTRRYVPHEKIHSLKIGNQSHLKSTGKKTGFFSFSRFRENVWHVE